MRGPYVTEEEWRKQVTDVTRAASHGVWVATQTKRTLGEAARAFGYTARTLTGDAFETAFEWARDQMEFEDQLGGL